MHFFDSANVFSLKVQKIEDVISTSPNGDRTVGVQATNWAIQCSLKAYGLLFLSALNSRSILLDLLEFVFHSFDYYQFIINLA